ncbi:MAG: hypothetical protein JNM22_00685 [Saprospiraceae bacterium]|nr:hypothetical protein [Saprospiraceae bacterium]
MSKKETLKEELESLSPFLQQQKQRRESMHVPADYFDQLEDAVFSKLESEGALRPAMTARHGGVLRSLWKPRMWAAAAAVAVIAVASWWMLRPQPLSPVPDAMYTETLTEDEIEEYVIDNITEFDSEQLASIAPEPELSETTNTTPNETPDSKALDDISPAEMENLLQQMSEEELESLL